MLQKIYPQFLLFIFCLVASVQGFGELKSRWYGDLKISPDGTKVAFASGYQNESGAGIYVLNLKSDSWILMKDANQTLRSPVWSADSEDLFVIASEGSGVASTKNKVIRIELNSGKTKNIFSSDMVLGNLTRLGDSHQMMYSQRPFCNLQPSERCGLTADLYFFNDISGTHRRLTKIWSDFTRPQLVDERSIIVQLPFYHQPNKNDQRGASCGLQNIDHGIYKIEFPKPYFEIDTPILADCSWKPLIKGALGNSSQPILDKSGTQLIYLSVDKSQKSWVRSVYMHDLKTGKVTLIRKTSSVYWDFIDMTPDGRYVVNLHSANGEPPQIWWKDLKKNKEKEISPNAKNVTAVILKNN